MSGVWHAVTHPVSAVKHLVSNPASAIVPVKVRNSSIYKNVVRPVIKTGTGALIGYVTSGFNPLGAVAGGLASAAGGGLTNKPFNPVNSIVLPAAAGLTVGAVQGTGIGGDIANSLGGGGSASGNIQSFLANPASAGAGQTSASVLGGSGSSVGSLLGSAKNALGGLTGSGSGGGTNYLKLAGQIGGAIYGSNSAKKAAQLQADAAAAANQTTLAMYNQNRADLAPWAQVGGSALSQLGAESLGVNAPLTRAFTTADFQADPGYQFRKEQGMLGINNRLNSMGMNNSGQSLKESIRFNQGNADQAYQAAYGRFNADQSNRFNRLNSISNTGVNAAGRVANLGANAATSVAANQIGAGNAQAAGRIGSSNAYLNALNNVQQIGANNRFNNAIGGAY